MQQPSTAADDKSNGLPPLLKTTMNKYQSETVALQYATVPTQESSDVSSGISSSDHRGSQNMNDQVVSRFGSSKRGETCASNVMNLTSSGSSKQGSGPSRLFKGAVGLCPPIAHKSGAILSPNLD